MWFSGDSEFYSLFPDEPERNSFSFQTRIKSSPAASVCSRITLFIYPVNIDNIFVQAVLYFKHKLRAFIADDMKND